MDDDCCAPITFPGTAGLKRTETARGLTRTFLGLHDRRARAVFFASGRQSLMCASGYNCCCFSRHDKVEEATVSDRHLGNHPDLRPEAPVRRRRAGTHAGLESEIRPGLRHNLDQRRLKGSP